MEEKKKGKGLTVVIILAVLAIAAAGIYYFLSRNDNAAGSVYVSPVKSVASYDTGIVNKYSGIVEAQETVDFKLDSSKVLKETFVKEGDEVKIGDKLFSYDVNSIKLEIEQIKLDIQRLQDSIEQNKETIEELKKQRDAASADEQLDYTLRIKELENQNSSTSYSIKAKKNELTSKQEASKNTDVLSTIDGTVKSVGDPNSEAYISIISNGEFVVKSTINELNIYQMGEGTRVIVYSRIDDRTWEGEVTGIDTGSPIQSNDYYFGEDTSLNSSKYYFYVALDSCENLFLGQHVIVKPTDEFTRDGLWLSEYYIVDADSNPYVWIQKGSKIAKGHLTLGEYDDATYEYQILGGLDVSDYIAYPSEEITEGMKTTTEYSE